MYETNAKQAPSRDCGQVETYLNRIAGLVDEAIGLHKELESRLAPVTRSEVTGTISEMAKIGEVLVPIADVLSQKSNILADLIERQRSLLQRLEL